MRLYHPRTTEGRKKIPPGTNKTITSRINKGNEIIPFEDG